MTPILAHNATVIFKQQFKILEYLIFRVPLLSPCIPIRRVAGNELYIGIYIINKILVYGAIRKHYVRGSYNSLVDNLQLS